MTLGNQCETSVAQLVCKHHPRRIHRLEKKKIIKKCFTPHPFASVGQFLNISLAGLSSQIDLLSQTSLHHVHIQDHTRRSHNVSFEILSPQSRLQMMVSITKRRKNIRSPDSRSITCLPQRSFPYPNHSLSLPYKHKHKHKHR